MTDKIAVLTACDSPKTAARLARRLVEERLAACVNLFPGVRSVYRWQGKIEESQELMLLIKSSRQLLPALIAELEKIHPYEVPEIVALPIVDGGKPYLDWLDRELAGSPEPST
ncbi:MAG: divalent-cation tolerance protein CutA [Bryobacteraceae bacterium]